LCFYKTAYILLERCTNQRTRGEDQYQKLKKKIIYIYINIE